MGVAGDALGGVILAMDIANTALPLLVNTAPCSAGFGGSRVRKHG